MKTASVKQLKQELNDCSQSELLELCLRLSRFKKENKELLSYLLFEVSDENQYIENIKVEMSQQFSEINTDSYFYIKKSVRKILRRTKTYIRYSKQKETEVELLLYFCSELKDLRPSITNNVTLTNIYNRQMAVIKKTVASLHEDLQYDYEVQLSEMEMNDAQ